jgi:hypothetical protein
MNTYKFYKEMKREYGGHVQIKSPDRESWEAEWLGFLKKSKERFVIRSGELYPFIDKALTDKAIDQIESKGSDYFVDLTCGDWIVGEQGEYAVNNYFLDYLLMRVGKNPRNTKIKYNPWGSLDQIAHCNFHCMIFDRGTACLEEPHGYRSEYGTPLREWQIVEMNDGFVHDLESAADAYDRLVGNDMLIVSSKFPFDKVLNVKGFFDKVKKEVFNGEDQYIEKQAEMFHVVC